MSKKTKQILGAVLRAAAAMLIFVLAVTNYDRLKNIDVRALVAASSGVLAAVFAVWGVYLVKSVLFIIPAGLIYIAVGMAFSPVQAILINLIGIVIEVSATYLLGMLLGGEYVNALLMKNKGGRKILEKGLNNRFSVLFGIRALPVFPIDFVSLFWGASRCGFIRYFFASALGIMPRVILFTVLGDGIYDYIPIHLIVKIAVCAIPAGTAAYLVRYFVKLRKEEKGAADGAKLPQGEEQ